MVYYRDPEDHPDRAPSRVTRVSPAERMKRLREKHAALGEEEAYEVAKEHALRQLDARPRSRAELTSALKARGFNPETIQCVLDRLEDVGLVNDRLFAQMLVRERFTLQGKTGRAIREELTRKGICREDAEAALSQINRDDEYARARELAVRKARSLGGDPRTLSRRLVAALARKGYSPSICMNVAREVLDDWEHDDDDY